MPDDSTSVRRVDLPALTRGCDASNDWPLPAGGQTRQRWALLGAAAYADLVVGRLIEAHADAVAINAELGGSPVRPGQRWGVWAAGPPTTLTAEPTAGGLRLDGHKDWCSGATLLTHALVTADCAGEQILCAVDLSDASIHPAAVSWVGAGMAAADTRTVHFAAAPATPVGTPGGYLARPGFWLGGIGVAACWHGGTARVAQLLLARAADGTHAHAFAHLGAVHTLLAQNQALFRDAGAEADARPAADHQVLARTVRSAAERAAAEVIDRVGRALGPAPLAHNAGHSALVVDLAVYVRQHHAERDLEALGRDIAGTEPPWLP